MKKVLEQLKALNIEGLDLERYIEIYDSILQQGKKTSPDIINQFVMMSMNVIDQIGSGKLFEIWGNKQNDCIIDLKNSLIALEKNHMSVAFCHQIDEDTLHSIINQILESYIIDYRDLPSFDIAAPEDTATIASILRWTMDLIFLRRISLKKYIQLSCLNFGFNEKLASYIFDLILDHKNRKDLMQIVILDNIGRIIDDIDDLNDKM